MTYWWLLVPFPGAVVLLPLMALLAVPGALAARWRDRGARDEDSWAEDLRKFTAQTQPRRRG